MKYSNMRSLVEHVRLVRASVNECCACVKSEWLCAAVVTAPCLGVALVLVGSF